jgi:hypothetical protein
LLDELRRIHREQHPEQAPARSSDDAYGRIREIFQKRQATLRQEASVVDRILDRMRSDRSSASDPANTVLQQDLRVQCEPGGKSRGRFVVANDSSSRCTIGFHPGRLRGIDPDRARGLALRFSPESVSLEGGESHEVDVFIDLSASGPSGGERLEWPIDFRAGHARVGRLWLDIVVTRIER